MPAMTKPATALLRNTLGYKVTDAELVALIPFFDTFDGRSASAAHRWLLGQPAVQQLINDRIRAGMVDA